MGLFTKEREEVPVTVEVSHRFESLHAHVRFDNGAVVTPVTRCWSTASPWSLPGAS